MGKRVNYMLSYMVEGGGFHLLQEFDGEVDLQDDKASYNEGMRVVGKLREQTDLMEKLVREHYENPTA